MYCVLIYKIIPIKILTLLINVILRRNDYLYFEFRNKCCGGAGVSMALPVILQLVLNAYKQL